MTKHLIVALTAVSTLTFALAGGFARAERLTADDPRVLEFESGLIDRMERGLDDARRWSIHERLSSYGVPGTAIAIVRNGEIAWLEGYGTKLAGRDDPVDGDTVFSVGSVSKVINAALILRLVAEGRVDLDTDVNKYLESWRVPDSRYSAEQEVTLRRILSHTAGFNVHGFADYPPGAELPTTVEILEGRRPARNDAVRLMSTPGELMDYSGGGITVSQAVVEDVTGLSYAAAARRYVFGPLGMTRSTFVNPLPASHDNIARAHDERGRPTALPRGWEAMPEQAASGLWTSARDLARFLIAINDDGSGAFLPRELRDDMLTREPQSWHGLGPRLNGAGATRVFHHGGTNDSYRAWIEGHVESGDGLVVLTNGREGAWVRSEIRKSVEDAFDWPVKSDGGFEEPEF